MASAISCLYIAQRHRHIVESRILCLKTSSSQVCEVMTQRHSQLPHMPSTVTYLSFRESYTGNRVASQLNAAIRSHQPIPELYNPTSEIGIISGKSSSGIYSLTGNPQTPLAQLSLHDLEIDSIRSSTHSFMQVFGMGRHISQLRLLKASGQSSRPQ
jgi:hypothetical protein